MHWIDVNCCRLRELRLDRGLRQRELAKLAGVAERTIRHAEGGQRIRPEFLGYIAKALGVETSDLVQLQ